MKNKGLIISVAHKFVLVLINKKIIKVFSPKKITEKKQLLVGDLVEVEFLEHNEAVIKKVMLRKNQLYRPEIANVDQVLIVNSMKKPNFNTLMLNKMLTICNYYALNTSLIFSKTDLVTDDDEIWKKISWYQLINYNCLFFSNYQKETIDQIQKILINKISVLTGLSGVGKSSLLNNLDSTLKLKTNEISIALKHGKHTTTQTRLYQISDGLLADTPGFMTLKIIGLSLIEIAQNFPLIKDYYKKCQFLDCLHQNEPNCCVKKNIGNSRLLSYFYQDYCKIISEEEKIIAKKKR